MATNVEILSKEMIKPSSPTPTHLKTLKLSFLDQVAPPVYTPLIFFYHHQQLITVDPQEISRSLKQSLSEILSIFYPLGGIVEEKYCRVDCNDSGAEFSEARVGARLSDVIQADADVEELNKLVPVESPGENENNIVLKVRLNFFECGGVGVAICLWHVVGDGTSLVAFIRAWAATCRGETEMIGHPSFDLASFFPAIPVSESLNIIQEANISSGEKLVTKRYVFSKEMIAKLKEKEELNGGVANPTRVEVVSSYICRRFIEAGKAKESSSLFAASHTVNIRPRKTPTFSQHLFGNCWRPVGALLEGDYSEIAVKLRAAITSVDDDYVKRVGSEAYVEEHRKIYDANSWVGVEVCNFSSWCRFPVYEVDFGWGKPARVCTTTTAFKNLVILMATPTGDEGIEAWVNMLQHDIQIFDRLIFASSTITT